MLKIHNYVMKIAASKRTAFCAFVASTALLAACLWKECDQWRSYFAQQWCWTPPVLVISSDDWGGANPPETAEDLEKLRDTLQSVTDAAGSSLVLTAYLNPAEPDFERISESKYETYFYRYCYRDKPDIALRLHELHEAGFIDIEFHGREHFNIPLWLSLLKEDHPGFREGCRAGHVPWREGPGWDVEADPRLPFLRQSFLDASSYPTKSLSIEQQREMIASGLAMMESELGIRPTVFTPPGYAYDTNTLHAMSLAGIQFLDSVKRTVTTGDYAGQLVGSEYYWDYGVDMVGIKGIVRNVSFEPYKRGVTPRECLERTMIAVRRALLSGRPVVVSSHRWNYVAAVDPNRDGNLLLLQELAMRIKAEAPEVLFLGASDLAKHLYLRGAGARRNVKLKSHSLSGVKRLVHGLRCTWLGHSRIRVAVCIACLSFLWLCIAGSLRKRLNGARDAARLQQLQEPAS